MHAQTLRDRQKVLLDSSLPEANPFRANLLRREIPSLYGLRGLAALAVVVWHYLEPWKLNYLYPGPYAVTMFFELSGILITWLLLKEQDATGRINKVEFYSRRALRLFPVFYLVWALCRLVGPFAGRWAYFFYMGDYYVALTHQYGPLTQAWSLGVEEKFYVVWPLLLAHIERKNLIKLCVAVLVCEPIYRFVLSSLGYREYTWFAFDAHLDAIVLGCLLALAARQGWRAPRWFVHPIVPVAALVGIFLFQHLSDVVIYLLGLLLTSVICRPPRLLNNPIIYYFGLISYSIYLCHGYALTVVWPRISGFLPTHSVGLILTYQTLLAIVLASVLHFTIERPFLRLKRRLHPAPISS